MTKEWTMRLIVFEEELTEELAPDVSEHLKDAGLLDQLTDMVIHDLEWYINMEFGEVAGRFIRDNARTLVMTGGIK